MTENNETSARKAFVKIKRRVRNALETGAPILNPLPSRTSVQGDGTSGVSLPVDVLEYSYDYMEPSQR